MKKLYLVCGLAIAALLGSFGIGSTSSHLAVCPGSSFLWTASNYRQDPSKGWHNCIGKQYFDDGTYFKGEWQNGKLNGQCATFTSNYLEKHKLHCEADPNDDECSLGPARSYIRTN